MSFLLVFFNLDLKTLFQPFSTKITKYFGNSKAPESHQLFNLHLQHHLFLSTFSPEQYGALLMHLLIL